MSTAVKWNHSQRDEYFLLIFLCVHLNVALKAQNRGLHVHSTDQIIGHDTFEDLQEPLLPPSSSLEVYKRTMKAVQHFYRMNKEDNALARKGFEEAIALA